MNILRIIQEILTPFDELEVLITFAFFYELLSGNMGSIFAVFIMNWTIFPEGILPIFMDFLTCIMWNTSETRGHFPVDYPWESK